MVIVVLRRDHQYIEERTDTGIPPPWRSPEPGTRPPSGAAAGPQQAGQGAGPQSPPWGGRGHHGQPWNSHIDKDWRWGPHGRARGPWRVPRDRGPIRRSRDERMVGGVAGGLARRFGIDPTVVRVIILATSLSGYGAAAYVVAWLLIPADGEAEPIAKRALADTRGIALALAFLPLAFVALLVGSVLGAGWIGSFASPAFVGAAGLVLIWRNADASEQAVLHRAVDPLLRLSQPPDGSGRSARVAVRVLGSSVLVAGGMWALLSGHATRTFRPLLGLLLVIAAIVTIFGPWWLRVARDLVVERQARARAEERAEVAARVHDSVLQTLALIQRKADQPQHVVQLARAQERELRSWLFDGGSPGAASGQDASFAAGVNRIQGEVEALHGVPVEVVLVGDCDLDEGLRSLLAAGREAANNAAKWSGAPTLSLFGEVEPRSVSLFVRDRGIGFDPEGVGEDRKGIAESIRGRMARHGGTVAIRSTPGAGTEVALTMAREPGRRARSGRP
jgi:signal transduction histidine kinase/phage shock protein PspC (stress-responsive transcriptional regulator)